MFVRTQPKAESLSHISVGQRPTKRGVWESRLKALRITHGMGFRPSFIRKAYSLDCFGHRIRRALPYANIRKAFGLVLKQKPLRPPCPLRLNLLTTGNTEGAEAIMRNWGLGMKN